MKVAILGTGAFGLALSKLLVDNNNEITMWTTFEEEKEELINTKTSSKLKGYILNDSIKITTSLEEAITDSKLIVIAIPMAFIRNVCKQMKKYYKTNQTICIASKGIEQNTCMFSHEIVKKVLKTRNVGVISGPSFAIDLINSVPVGLSAASKNKKVLKTIDKAFSSENFKLYPTNDIIGVEVCGAFKNVIALETGIIDGMGYPISTQALLITDSLHDVRLLISKLGGSKRSILGFSGFGDILITCTSEKSRNYSFGKLIGANISKEELENYRKNNTIEGLYTLTSIHKLINEKKIDIPSINILYDIIFNSEKPEKLIEYITI